RLGGTPFQLGEFVNRLEGEVILPLSELNQLRRQIVSKLEELRARPRRWTLERQAPNAQRAAIASRAAVVTENTRARPKLVVLVPSLAQLEAALSCGVETIYCEFEDPKKYREAVHRFRNYHETSCSQSAFRNPHRAIWVAPPRIFKTGEEWVLTQVHSCEADGYLLRNYDHLKYFA